MPYNKIQNFYAISIIIYHYTFIRSYNSKIILSFSSISSSAAEYLASIKAYSSLNYNRYILKYCNFD
jgi:hypothetical protein